MFFPSSSLVSYRLKLCEICREDMVQSMERFIEVSFDSIVPGKKWKISLIQNAN